MISIKFIIPHTDIRGIMYQMCQKSEELMYRKVSDLICLVEDLTGELKY